MTKPRATSGREIRQRVSVLLDAGDLHPALHELRKWPHRRVLRALLASLSEGDEERKGRAVSVLGLLTAEIAREDMGEARELMRRLMWSLNEESGSSGWGAPEAMAEIMAVHEGLAEEYAHMLVSYMREDGNYLENPLLQRDLLRGIGRLSRARPDLMKGHGADLHLLGFLESSDRVVQGLAAWCAGILEVDEARPGLEALVNEETEIVFYTGHGLTKRPLGDLAREALERIDEKGHSLS
ncbi:MAG: DVU0298 family protein [Thermodesulfobacteriota bacterium]